MRAENKIMSIVTIETLQSDKIRLVNSLSSLAQTGLRTQEQKDSYKRGEEELTSVEARIAALQGISRKLNGSESRQAKETLSDIQSTVAKIAAPAIAPSPESKRQQLRKSYLQFIKGEQRDLLSNSDAAGEATVPQEFGVLTQATKLFGPIASLVNVRYETNGRAVKMPISNDVANFATLVAQGNSGAEGDPILASAVPTVTADSLRTKTIASIQLFEDSLENGTLEDYLVQLFGVRVGRSLESLVTLGKDPAGNVAAASPTGGLLASLSPLTTTAAVADSIGFSDFTAAFAALDPSYLRSPNARVFMNWATMMALADQRDDMDRPFWTPNTQSGIDSILGVKVELNQALPNIAANTTPIIVGDVSKAYSITLSPLKTQRFQEGIGLVEQNLVELIGYVRVSASKLLSTAAGTIKIAAA